MTVAVRGNYNFNIAIFILGSYNNIKMNLILMLLNLWGVFMANFLMLIIIAVAVIAVLAALAIIAIVTVLLIIKANKKRNETPEIPEQQNINQ